MQAYNQQCSAEHRPGQESAPPGQKHRSPVSIRLGVQGGLRVNSVHFDGQGQTNTVLDGYSADGRAHPQIGIYADAMDGSRRLALHAAVLASSFGRSKSVPFGATANTLPAATSGTAPWRRCS